MPAADLVANEQMLFAASADGTEDWAAEVQDQSSRACKGLSSCDNDEVEDSWALESRVAIHLLGHCSVRHRTVGH